MSNKSTQLESLKEVIIREMFIDTADEAYIVARWCYFSGLIIPFYWNALHAIEKYLKATLLINGKTSIKQKNGKIYSHNLNALFDDTKDIASEFLPTELEKPEGYGDGYWHIETLSGFLSRLNKLGDPNNRYDVYGYAQKPEDLYKVDAAVFALRRIIVCIDCQVFNADSSKKIPNISNADLLRKGHSNFRPQSRFHVLTGKSAAAGTRFAGLERNFFFANEDYESKNDNFHYQSSFHNEALYRHILEPAQKATGKNLQTEKLTAELGDWVVNNIHLPKKLKSKIKDAIAKLKK